MSFSRPIVGFKFAKSPPPTVPALAPDPNTDPLPADPNMLLVGLACENKPVPEDDGAVVDGAAAVALPNRLLPTFAPVAAWVTGFVIPNRLFVAAGAARAADFGSPNKLFPVASGAAGFAFPNIPPPDDEFAGGSAGGVEFAPGGTKAILSQSVLLLQISKEIDIVGILTLENLRELGWLGRLSGRWGIPAWGFKPIQRLLCPYVLCTVIFCHRLHLLLRWFCGCPNSFIDYRTKYVYSTAWSRCTWPRCRLCSLRAIRCPHNIIPIFPLAAWACKDLSCHSSVETASFSKVTEDVCLCQCVLETLIETSELV